MKFLVLALVAAVLGVVAVPLGVITANQDTRDFRDEAAASATTASVPNQSRQVRAGTEVL